MQKVLYVNDNDFSFSNKHLHPKLMKHLLDEDFLDGATVAFIELLVGNYIYIRSMYYDTQILHLNIGYPIYFLCKKIDGMHPADFCRRDVNRKSPNQFPVHWLKATHLSEYRMKIKRSLNKCRFQEQPPVTENDSILNDFSYASSELI